MRLSNKQQRHLVRAAHLVFAAALGCAIYAPLDLVLGVRVVMQVGVFPVLTLTGLWLWYGPRLRQWWRHRYPSTPTPTSHPQVRQRTTRHDGGQESVG
jgi:hypothetical protein